MPRSALLPALFVLCCIAAPAGAQFGEEPLAKDPLATSKGLPKKFAKLASVEFVVEPAKAKRGETVTARLKVTLKEGGGGYTYPFFPADTKQLGKNDLAAPLPVGDLVFIGTVADPPNPDTKQRDDAPSGVMDQIYKHLAVWEFKAVVSPNAKAGKSTVSLGKYTRLQVCDATNCYPARGDELPAATFEVLDGESDKIKPADLEEARKILNLPPPKPSAPDRGSVGALPPAPSGSANKAEVRKSAKPLDQYTDELRVIATNVLPPEEGSDFGGIKQTGLWAFIATAALWGLISLVTPCVFPMIPITVSIFLKQAHGSFGERLKLAGVYCLTIISVLGLSAFALLKFMAWLSAHPVTNVLLATLFLVLALSLFGMYELTLPNALQKRLQAKQSKGGVIGTVFGALAFTVISFTCVAPFLGGFAGISAGNEGSGSLIAVPTAKEIAGGLAFATAFAAPFFVLALVPGLMKALPKSGGWLDSVKAVMGFLELAAALKFLRTAELRVFPTTQYFTYDLVLGAWVAISAACGLYLLNVFRLPHDEEKPNIGVPRLLFALLFLGLALYLTPALFKGHDGKNQRPAGVVYAWVEAFLLPDPEEWPTDLNVAIEASKKSGKPVFVDFTGKTCTNCRYNEREVFSRPEFHSLFDQFELVQLYTDEVPSKAYATDPGHSARIEEADVNGRFLTAVFKDNTLPTYAVMITQPDGKVKVFKYPEGKINHPDQFATFLKDSLEKAKK
ncbi:thiol:disulfide interchange protein : Thiol:disulfide interchange protein OS=Singulisphaera acidiphila (strain ATCC BAA-1392 / DSM 18658 / VKM B-2454 / MOB10) GN=Sinac_3167 PE=4 SV=1: Thioredoxin_7 [Gemmata massiliana]|uniref:Thioredoxin domain-containing protein n=1 Tax=Gemmata massiliana TaxID=1210884 RepID=A0A6P2DJ41_9BACT|nr:thioredoxin family protein [Gemmata massiliana]VTS02385.1 thiol:disulfide interchange protein : Thiol:disulfide interchange protein OS=Singulisphaera acidiphila (strain ATCC BAA-1392 / DSM 18658 / VKM B-2454 / MOB10) GN=Sinac_3167 PE=4 SV=1: Thioredoxin_7 [Gemmata massiliana]